MTDAGLAHLKGLPNLSILSLSGSEVTDSGVAHLRKLAKLVYLDLSKNSRVSDFGKKELKQAIPGITITD